MIYPEVRHIQSSDLEPPNLPPDPLDCEIAFQAFIGPGGTDTRDKEEVFNFTVITPTRLAHSTEAAWGRGRLIIPLFDWAVVAQSVAALLVRCARPTWEEVAAELNKEMLWEFDRHPSDGEQHV